MEKTEIEAADIMLGYFHYIAGETDKPHPVLVLEVKDWGIRVAYGTSQDTNVAPLPHELVLSEEEALLCGLKKATKFDLKYRDLLPTDLTDPAWVCPQGKSSPRLGALHPKLYQRLRRAAVAAGYV